MARIENDKTEAVKKAVTNEVRALTESALIVEGAAKANCPVDTGNLRSSINHKVDATTAQVGTNVEYSEYVEYGTSKMAAQPYLRPALDSNIEAIKRVMKEKYGVAIREVTG
jgi:HK97 gp10 family phage protein